MELLGGNEYRRIVEEEKHAENYFHHVVEMRICG
jgi:hypothetical protein